MKTFIVAAFIGMAALAGPQAQAAGCLSGAVIGGVAGHMAGHHGLLGAAGGCAIGHHMARRDQARAQRYDNQGYDNRGYGNRGYDNQGPGPGMPPR